MIILSLCFSEKLVLYLRKIIKLTRLRKFCHGFLAESLKLRAESLEKFSFKEVRGHADMR